MNVLMRWCVGMALLGLVGLSPVWAVMPPEYEAQAAWERVQKFQRQREAAQDVVRLRVDKLDATYSEERCPQIVQWEMQATLLAVSRGGLQPGAPVRIRQEWAEYHCPGPVHEALPKLAPGDETEAYLNCQPDGACELAAGRQSFLSQADFAAVVQARKESLEDYFPPPMVVAFKQNRTLPEEQAELEPQFKRLCERLRYRPALKIRLQGYADDRSSHEVCLIRSARNVAWVKRKLLEAGCEADRIRDFSYGKEKNSPGDVTKGTPLNRVELDVVNWR